MNITIKSGRLGKDPKVSQTQSGRDKLTFRMAVDDGYTKDGHWVERTHWFSVTVYNGAAQFLLKKELKKGDLVLVHGADRNFRDKDDKEVHYIEADRVEVAISTIKTQGEYHHGSGYRD